MWKEKFPLASQKIERPPARVNNAPGYGVPPLMR